MKRMCILRDLDNDCDTTAPVDCIQAVKVNESRPWRESCSIEELVENPIVLSML